MKARQPLASRVATYLRHRMGLPPRLVDAQLGEATVRVRYGLIPSAPDKDDGWMAAAILESRVFLDVGCNVGLWSLFASITDPARKVVAWDTNAMALARCFENLALNDCVQQARFVLGFASSSDDEAVEFFTVGTGAAGSRYRGHATTASKQGRSISVRSRTIDRVMNELGVTPDLVKLDVEGAESETLQGARKLAIQSGPRFIVEMHSPPELPMRANTEHVLRWCSETGYTAYYLAKHAELLSADDIAHRGRCHLLLMPKGSPYPNQLASIPEGASIAGVLNGSDGVKRYWRPYSKRPPRH